jgi:hypothetical protein
VGLDRQALVSQAPGGAGHPMGVAAGEEHDVVGAEAGPQPGHQCEAEALVGAGHGSDGHAEGYRCPPLVERGARVVRWSARSTRHDTA